MVMFVRCLLRDVASEEAKAVDDSDDDLGGEHGDLSERNEGEGGDISNC